MASPRIRPSLVRGLCAAVCLIVTAALAAGCRGGSSGPEDTTASMTSPRGDPARGVELTARFECNRCHEGAWLTPPAQEKQCFRCHQEILSGAFRAPEEVEPLWRERVKRLAAVPTLPASTKHYRRAFIERFLLEPYDLRPHLAPTMPRLAITPAEARDIATALAPDDEVPSRWRGASLDRGRALLDAKGCGTCHFFTGVPPLSAQPPAPGAFVPRAVELAPDLRHVRDRLQPDAIITWLRAPGSIKAGTLMPDSNLSEDEARDIAFYLVTADLSPAQPLPVPARLPPLERRVSFEEVSQKVLRRTCWHCHGEPDYTIGDAGPGNTGGFGFKPRGLSLSDYGGVASGYLDDHGERQSVFAKMADGTPRLVRALLARQAEVAGRPDPEIRGMPLGLPPLSPEEVQLVEAWIAQGRPE